MIPVEVATAFFAASVALALAPGPDNLFVLTLSALHGRVAGWIVVLGLCTGLLVHISAVALGLAALVLASPTAFLVIKFVGAGYLLWLAWGAFRAGAAGAGDSKVEQLPAGALYLRGIVMNVTNPKVGLFFLAFLPQFVDAGRGPVALQVGQLGLLFILATALIFGAIAWGAGALSDWFGRSPVVEVWLNRVAGVVFVALAVRLALAAR